MEPVFVNIGGDEASVQNVMEPVSASIGDDEMIVQTAMEHQSVNTGASDITVLIAATASVTSRAARCTTTDSPGPGAS